MSPIQILRVLRTRIFMQCRTMLHKFCGQRDHKPRIGRLARDLKLVFIVRRVHFYGTRMNIAS
jgi:hypothetical protein